MREPRHPDRRQGRRRYLSDRGAFARRPDLGPDHVLALHRLADDGKGVLPDLVFGGEVVRAVEIPLVDLGTGHEFFNVDRVRAFEPKRFEFFVFDGHELVAPDLVPAALVGGLDEIAGDRVDGLLFQPVARPFIDLSK